MKVIICGSRSIRSYEVIAVELDKLKDTLPITEIVSGDAQGPDTLGSEWATTRNIPVKHFPAQWDKYGKSAGFIRNAEMGQYADYMVAFWNGKSKGTKHMIDYMKKHKHGMVIIYD